MPGVVIAIPVRDEAALIGDCLRALALQQDAARAEILLLVNNSSDDTAGIARALQPTLPCRLHVLEHRFPAGQASAGHARRLAMARGARLADPGGVVITTDADGAVAPDWLGANLDALAAGADAVCGRAVIDPVDALLIPQHLHDDDAREVAYGHLLDHIAHLLDPDQADPWPRHTEASGASIAVRREVFLAAGGVPPMRAGEDRALVAALRRIDARIRHAPDVTVTVSGRVVGRATGGMADTIRRRMERQDPTVDGALEPAADRVRRIGLRRLLRQAWRRDAGREDLTAELAAQLELPRRRVQGWLALPHFGAAWALAEGASPRLQSREVLRASLASETTQAQEILFQLQAATPGIASAEPARAPIANTPPSS